LTKNVNKLIKTAGPIPKNPIFSGIGCGGGALCFALITPKRVSKTDAKQFLAGPKAGENTENEAKNPETALSEKSDKFTLSDLWQFLKTHKTTLAVSILCALAAAYFNIQIPICLGSLVDSVADFLKNEQPLTSPEFWAIISPKLTKLFTLYSAQALSTFGLISSLFSVGEKVATDLKQNLFAQLVNYELGYFDKSKTHDICQVLDSDIQEFKHSFKKMLSQGIKASTQILGCIGSLWCTSNELTASIAIALPVMVGIGRLISGGLRKLSKQTREENAKASSFSGEAIEQIKTVKVFNGEEFETAKYEKQLSKMYDCNFKFGIGIAGFQALTSLALNGIVGATVAYGGWLVNEQKLTGGDLMTFLTASQMIQRSLAQISQLAAEYVKLSGAGVRIKNVLNYNIDEKSVRGDKTKPFYSLLGHLSFNNVDFCYPARAEQKVLEDVSFSMLGNETVAIVGQTGSGKSTVASLLTRLYEPTGGRIYLDGVGIETYCPKWLRGKAVGVVTQEPTLFDMSIKENIRYGRPSASDQEIYEVAERANCTEFISNLPKGFETNVGERGSQLSGGQKQRVAIARALIKNPSILILDEATSALDAQSENLVQSALNDASNGRSTLIIAHRLSTVRHADKIVVLHQGRVVEVGKHDELVKKDGRYAQLVKNQQFG
jgi:ATP-binding cassette subfamily B (MDR/TAP) protein 8